jgi:hypothetical protein
MPHEAVRMDAAFHRIMQKHGEPWIGPPPEHEVFGGINKFHEILISGSPSKASVRKHGDRMLEIQSKKVHGEIYCTTTATLCSGVPELWSSAKQFDILSSDISMPASSPLVSTRLKASIFLGVIRQRP